MPDTRHTVLIDRQFEELMPAFMENRRKDLHALRVALQSDDLEGLRLLGDRIKSVGGSYGFVRVAALGRLIEDSAKKANRAALHTLVEQYAQYLGAVEIRFGP